MSSMRRPYRWFPIEHRTASELSTENGGTDDSNLFTDYERVNLRWMP
ncbi:MAG: hypothetical protein M2R45_04678 [Verrucomicrobia subdivision 3 bacterium]|nr:hypothetical protein [Limisphaerales bacterium]MCS1416601.1 hypothetical protein [Limisphaerales bacterium]